MADASQLQHDLSFVRDAVVRREATRRTPPAIPLLWACYVLVGYAMIDFAPRWAGWFFMVGGFGGGIVSAWLGKRAEIVGGEVDRVYGRRAGLHWMGGILLAIVSVFGLSVVIPALRGNAGSQVLVVVIGVVYFLAGVHFERHYLWLGPVLIAGGLLVGFFPHYGWTALGVVIAVGLVVPAFFPTRSVPTPSAG